MTTLHRRRASTVTTNHLRLIASGHLTSPGAITATLTDAFGAGDYSAGLKSLHSVGLDPQSFIDGLENVCPRTPLWSDVYSRAVRFQAIDILSPGSDLHERCVREQSRACKIYGLLPASYKVKATLAMSEHAVASGGFSDIWKATNENGEVFAIKVFRLYESNVVQVKKATQFTLSPHLAV
jgi:hypothetical protein